MIFLKVLRKLRLSGVLNFSMPMTAGQQRVRIPLRGHVGWSYLNQDERWMSTLLKRLGPYLDESSEKAFVDVGANIGQTLLNLKAATTTCPYVGFEPNPTCAAYTLQLVAANKWSNVELFPVGVGVAPELLGLHFYYDNVVDSTASVVKQFRPAQKIARIEHIAVFPLVSALGERRVSFLKIDVEGGELEVLRGSADVIERDRPLVSTEILPVYEESNSFRLQRQEAIEAFFSSRDYRCFRISKSTDAAADLTRLERVTRIGVHSNIALCDYLWVPTEKQHVIEATFELTPRS